MHRSETNSILPVYLRKRNSRNYFPIIHNCRFVDLDLPEYWAVRARKIAPRVVFTDSRLQMPRIPERNQGSSDTSNSLNNGMANFRGRWTIVDTFVILTL